MLLAPRSEVFVELVGEIRSGRRLLGSLQQLRRGPVVAAVGLLQRTFWLKLVDGLVVPVVTLVAWLPRFLHETIYVACSWPATFGFLGGAFSVE